MQRLKLNKIGQNYTPVTLINIININIPLYEIKLQVEIDNKNDT